MRRLVKIKGEALCWECFADVCRDLSEGMIFATETGKLPEGEAGRRDALRAAVVAAGTLARRVGLSSPDVQALIVEGAAMVCELEAIAGLDGKGGAA